jgi:SPP1 gp7 family putative phage head morphogenesis protein
MPNLVSPTGKDIPLKPVRANAGIEANYRKKLKKLIADMDNSLTYWLAAAYKSNEPHALMAKDNSPAMTMRDAMRKLAKQWQSNFDDGALKLAVWFAKKNKDYSDGTLEKILKDAGFTVQFKMTAAANDAYQAIIGENVSLITNIAQQHLAGIEGLVMRSVQEGRDLHTLSEGLQKQFGITKRRAALISRDQNQKATAIITKTRQQEIGITQATWRHSSGGKVPRPEHVDFNGDIYDVSKGMWSEVDNKYVWPGTALNCRCYSVPVINGFIE